MKKFLALILSALLAIMCGAFMACTPADPGNGGGGGGGGSGESLLSFESKFGGSCYYVTGIGTETSTDIVIPATHNNKPVKGISDNAFNADEIGVAITSISLPASIENIGRYAFAYSAITTITIPAAVTEIYEYAFLGCDSLANVIFESTTGWGYLAIGSSVQANPVDVNNVSNSTTAATKFKTEDNDWHDQDDGEPTGWANFVLKK